MDITGIFLKLTSRTYPNGSELDLLDLMPDGYQIDSSENIYYIIGESETMFTSHMDTADEEVSLVTHDFIDDFVMTDGTTILGADCKAGVTIMLNMIHNKVPGIYYFFSGEEVGRIGSKFVEVTRPKHLENIKRVISFDRRGYNDIITHQLSRRTCSDEFGTKLANALNVHGFEYEISNDGGITDSYTFKDMITNCTNISVGYFEEHSVEEMQNIVFLEKLAKACVEIKWELL